MFCWKTHELLCNICNSIFSLFHSTFCLQCCSHFSENIVKGNKIVQYICLRIRFVTFQFVFAFFYGFIFFASFFFIKMNANRRNSAEQYDFYSMICCSNWIVLLESTLTVIISQCIWFPIYEFKLNHLIKFRMHSDRTRIVWPFKTHQTIFLKHLYHGYKFSLSLKNTFEKTRAIRIAIDFCFFFLV